MNHQNKYARVLEKSNESSRKIVRDLEEKTNLDEKLITQIGKVKRSWQVNLNTKVHEEPITL